MGGTVTIKPDAVTITPDAIKYLPGRTFGMDVARGLGLDADKIKAAEDAGGRDAAVQEIGSQVFEGLSNFVVSVAKDPFNIVKPLHGMASNLTEGVGLPDKGSLLTGYHTPSVGKTIGALASILGGAQGTGKVAEVASSAREAIGEAIHTEEGALKPGVKLAGKVGGGAAGAAIGSTVGHEYLGAAAGYKLGPSLLDQLFPESKASVAERAQAAEYAQRAEDLMRRGKAQDIIDRRAAINARLAAKAVPKITPFGEGATSTAGAGAPPTGLLSEMGSPTPFRQPSVQYVKQFEKPQGKIVSPESEPPDIKVTYQSIPKAELFKKVMSGDKLAVSEWQRRGLILPDNVRYLVEEAGPKPWRNYAR